VRTLKIGSAVALAARLAAILAVSAGATGCQSLAITTFAIGASTGVQHTIHGVGYRTFTAPSSKVTAAALAALAGMGIEVKTRKSIASGDVIKAATPDRSIELEVERISPNTTRLRAVATHYVLLRDGATANEIIMQTEIMLSRL
jgi:hypothetical protein